MFRLRLATQRPRTFDRTGGFSLLEMLVVIAILGFILVAALTFLDMTNRLALGQASKADVQQGVRASLNEITRKARTAGRGGLPLARAGDALPQGLAVSVRNNVPANTTILNGVASSDPVVEGTDILTIRGALTTPVYLTDATSQATPNPAFGVDANGMYIDVTWQTPTNGVWQPLDVLDDRLDPNTPRPPEAVILVSPFSDAVYGVAMINWNALNTSLVVREGTLDLDGDGTTNDLLSMRIPLTTNLDAIATGYAQLSAGGAFPLAELTNSGVAYIAFLQEFRYFVRNADLVPGVAAITDQEQRLTRAQVYPNSEVAYNNDASNLRVDLIDNVLDLQVAFGFDTDGDGLVNETPTGAADEWLLNNSNDLPVVAPWDAYVEDDAISFFQVMRLNILARGEVPDRKHRSRSIQRIEDMDYTTGIRADLNTTPQRLFQRQLISRMIDLRNL